MLPRTSARRIELATQTPRSHRAAPLDTRRSRRRGPRPKPREPLPHRRARRGGEESRCGMRPRPLHRSPARPPPRGRAGRGSPCRSPPRPPRRDPRGTARASARRALRAGGRRAPRCRPGDRHHRRSCEEARPIARAARSCCGAPPDRSASSPTPSHSRRARDPSAPRALPPAARGRGVGPSRTRAYTWGSSCPRRPNTRSPGSRSPARPPPSSRG